MLPAAAVAGGVMDWAGMDQAERDAAYNNGAACPDGAAQIEALAAASALVRAASPGELDRPYGPAERQRVDALPARPGAPCLVFIHGGYWQRNAREGFTALMDGVRAHGWAAALPGYTLAPDATLTDIAAEVRTALDWIGCRFSGPIILSGWSAGGHLAALLLDHPRVTAGLAISGVFELAPIRDTYLNEKLRLTEAEIEALSPLRLPPAPKPLVIAYGAAELPALVEDSRALHRLREAAGAPSRLLPLAGHDHFSILDELHSPTGALCLAARTLA